MLIITVAGPQDMSRGAMVKQLKNLLVFDRKIVRTYKEKDLPDPLPTDCDVIIIEKQLDK